MKPYLLIIAVTALSGCSAGMNNDFSCSGIDGITGCVSLDDVNTMVDNGQFRTNQQGAVIKTTKPTKQTVSSVNMPIAGLPLGRSLRPKRHHEDIRKITVLPYVDDKGNYHEQSVIYTVIQPTGWTLK